MSKSTCNDGYWKNDTAYNTISVPPKKKDQRAGGVSCAQTESQNVEWPSEPQAWPGPFGLVDFLPTGDIPMPTC